MDFFTQPCPAVFTPIRAYAEVFARQASLPSLPQHTHQMLGAFAVYHFIFLVVSPILSRLIVPSRYNKFPRRTQVNWDVHVVSFVQSSFICAFAIWVMFADADRKASGAAIGGEGALYRVFGYTGTGAAVQAYAAGYFLWDLMICVYYFDIMGWGFVAHAISALAVYTLGFVCLPTHTAHTLSLSLSLSLSLPYPANREQPKAPICKLLRAHLHPL